MVVPEDIVRAVVSSYESDYQTSLTAIEAKWSLVEPVQLENYKLVELSSSPTVLAPMWESPMMKVASGAIKTLTTGQQYMNRYSLEVNCYGFFRHTDQRAMSLLILRHAEAALDFFSRNATFGLGHATAIVPGSIAMYPSEPRVSSNTLVRGLLWRFDVAFLGRGV